MLFSVFHCKKNPVLFKINKYVDKYINKITEIYCEFTFNVK